MLESYVSYLAVLVSELRDFRFLYRDQADYGAHTDVLEQRLPHIYARSHENFAAFFRAMRDKGLLDISNGEIDALALNAIIVIRYHLEYLRESGQVETEGSGAVTKGIAQHLTLFSHRLTPAAKLALERRIYALGSSGLKIGDACVM